MSALWNLGAAFKGAQDYQDRIRARNQQQAQIDFEKLRTQALQQQMAQQQAELQRTQDSARLGVGMLSPPDQGPIPPPPGQSSQPMQPPAPPQQPPQQPTGLDISKLDPRMLAMLTRQNPQAVQAGVQRFQQTSQPPPIPPYQSMNGQGQGMPAPGMIPPQPQVSLDQIVQRARQMGITDPQAIMQVADKYVARMDVESRQRLFYIKEMQAEEDRRRGLNERERHNPIMEAIARDNANSNATRAATGQVRVSESSAQTPMGKLNLDLRNGLITQQQYDQMSKVVSKSKEGLTVADKMNPVMLATVRLDLAEGARALSMMKKKSLDRGSVFYADKDGASALKRLSEKFITPQDDAEFDVYANKLGQAIASAQSMGRGQISEAKINEAKKSIPVRGDSLRVRQSKMTELENFFKIVEETLKSPISGVRDSQDDQQDVNDFSSLWK